MMEKIFKIIVVDDDLDYAEACARALREVGYEVSSLDSAIRALSLIENDSNIRLVLTDLKMPEMGGIEFLKAIKSYDSGIEVIIMTGFGTIETAVKAIKEEAIDYISKPFNNEELLNSINKVYKVWTLQNEIDNLKQLVSDKLHFEGFIFKNDLMSIIYNKINSAARCNCTVLISGESGTGKELVAQAIHKNSNRSSEPFIPINCSTLSPQLIESELFGYKKGAFTGADRDYAGLFVAANKGTLFLDEIVEMDHGTQAKFLRAIQEKSIRPVGSVEERKVDVRFIAATNVDISKAVSEKKLREDLYYRLNVIQIDIPPLRKLKDEIPDLLNYFLNQKSEESDSFRKTIDNYAMKSLKDYYWPGNIREMDNLISQLYVESTDDVIKVSDLPTNISNSLQRERHDSQKLQTFSEAEKELVISALKEANGNKSKAAEILGISRPRLYKKIDQYRIKDL